MKPKPVSSVFNRRPGSGVHQAVPQRMRTTPVKQQTAPQPKVRPHRPQKVTLSSVPCSICDQRVPEHHMMCCGCANYSILAHRVAQIKIDASLDTVTQKIENIDKLDCPEKNSDTDPFRLRLLKIKQQGVRRELDAIRKARDIQADEIAAKKRQLATLRNQVSTMRESAASLHTQSVNEHQKIKRKLSQDVQELKTKVNTEIPQSLLTKRSVLCRELVSLYNIRLRKVRRGSGNTSVGSTTDTFPLIGTLSLPDIITLCMSSHREINTALDRLASFTCLAAYYLGAPLPYVILLPQKRHPYIRISNNNYPLFLEDPLPQVSSEKPAVFNKFAHALAMLCLNLASISHTLGFHSHLNTSEEIVKIDKIISRMFLTIEEEDPDGSEVTDVELSCLADYILTQVYLEVDGGGSEWVSL